MHFPTFTVANTNIFPLSNSTQGGQLVSEYNLRAREMVGSDPNVLYEAGPSYVHGMEDFYVSTLTNIEAPEYDSKSQYTIGQYVTYNSATYVCMQSIVTPEIFDVNKWLLVSSSSSILQVAPGRAVINGHYVQTLAPMVVDLALANAQLAAQSAAPLLGELCIGIRAYYSTESTMAGSMLVENTDNVYLGVQLVVETKANFKTPSDCPDSPDDVTAHLKLADIVYVNGRLTITQNKEKLAYVAASRISNITDVFDDNFISKTNLDPHRLYTFSGQGAYTSKDTWCDSTGSLMVWDSDPRKTTAGEPDPNDLIPQATFTSDTEGFVHLQVPHQQLDYMNDTEGNRIYYRTRDIRLPKANYISGAPGTVDANYTQIIKNLSDKVGSLQYSPCGSMILWLETKDADYEMPPILNSWSNGDYIFVREDYTASTAEDMAAAPSTMYKVIPGPVTSLVYSASQPNGIRLGESAYTIWAGTSGYSNLQEADLTHLDAAKYAEDTETPYQVGDYVAYNGGVYKCKQATTGGAWNGEAWEYKIEDLKTLFNYTTYRGTEDVDYFEIEYYNTNDTVASYYYYAVNTTDARAWSKPILVTGGIPLATTIQAGGFYNTDPTATDGGYVTLDENGRLKLIDYSLLRSGALAYQLGEDFTLPTNITSDEVQANLDEYVNNRVAFSFTPTESRTPAMIDIKITLPQESERTTINIYNIDSRFGTGVYLHFLGNADSNTIINIIDCQKIRIDSNIAGTPIINVVRSGIYYDANVFNYIRVCDASVGSRTTDFSGTFTGFEDITLWYDRFEDTDADLVVNGMEVYQPSTELAAQEISFWDDSNPNDNHYSSALRSITFNGNGDIASCSIYVANGSTATNVVTGRSIIGGSFNLPQGDDLIYPINCLVNSLRVTGSFTSAYMANASEWVVIATNFTAQTGVYNPSSGTWSAGTIAFDSITDLLGGEHVIVNPGTMDSWEPGSYHIFYGGATI